MIPDGYSRHGILGEATWSGSGPTLGENGWRPCPQGANKENAQAAKRPNAVAFRNRIKPKKMTGKERLEQRPLLFYIMLSFSGTTAEISDVYN